MQKLCAKWIDAVIHGYARVSTDGQSLSAQLDELKRAGCERVFKEKVSGARSDRRELAKLMSKLGNGDTLIVARLDRLARSSRDLLNILHEVTTKGAKFRSVHDAWGYVYAPRKTHGDCSWRVSGV